MNLGTLRFFLINLIPKRATMLTLAKIVLISTLSISLPYGSHEDETLETNTLESMAEVLKTTENKPMPLQTEANVNSNNESRNDSSPKTTNPSPWSSSRNYEIINSTNNLPTENFTGDLKSTATFSTSPPLFHGYVSKLSLNSSRANESLFPVSVHSNSTSAVPSENYSWSVDNDTIRTLDNSSGAVNIQPVSPLATEPTGWLTTDDESFASFTHYQEIPTPQPTVQFTNNSKVFPNTPDPQKENRNTAVVFGCILGAILGASLLSLVGYLLCRQRKTDSFSHRRLYDDRNEPVLRLDNAPEPYDMSFGNSSYYNPTVNEASMPESRETARDGIPMEDIPPLRTSV